MAVPSVENYDFILAVVNMLHEAKSIKMGGRGGGGTCICPFKVITRQFGTGRFLCTKVDPPLSSFIVMKACNIVTCYYGDGFWNIHVLHIDL